MTRLCNAKFTLIIADKFNAWKSSSKQQLVFNMYFAECEDQIAKM